MNTIRQSWTITESAQRCGVSKSTVRRYREGDRFPNAWKDDAQQWRIPLEDLLAVGWKPVDPNQVSNPVEFVSNPSERERELESLLAIEHAKREAAERVATMAQDSVEDLRRALRMLEQAPSRQTEQASKQALSTPGEQVSGQPKQARKRRWWQL